jgi:uncharacterized protein YoxC
MNWLGRFILDLIEDKIQEINGRIDSLAEDVNGHTIILDLLVDKIEDLTERIGNLEDGSPDYLSRILRLEYILKYHVSQVITIKSQGKPIPAID